MRLLLHQAALGDFVVTWPLLRDWAPAPAAVAANPSRAKMAARVFPHVSAHDIGSPEWSALFIDTQTPRRPAGLPEHVSLIVSMVSGEHDAFTRNLRRVWPGARVVCVEPRPPESWTGHVHAWHRHRLREAGLEWRSTQAPRGGVPHGEVLLHPGAGSESKRWPVERFAWLRDQLMAQGVPVGVVLGEVELERMSDRERATLGPTATPCHDVSQLAARISAAMLYVGNDSGPTHLAAQLGVPTLSLFGPTDPRRWRPLGPSVATLAPTRPCGIDWLSGEAVLNEVRRGLSGAWGPGDWAGEARA